MSEQSAAKSLKWPIILVAIGFFWLVGQCSHDDKKASSSISSSETTATRTAAAMLSTPAPPPAPAGPVAPEGVKFHVEPGSNGDVVFAEFAVHDNLTNGFIKRGAQMETVDILKYARDQYPAASQVVVQGTFQTKDTYGNLHPGTVVLNVRYNQETLQKINFDGISTGDIWDIRDGGTIHPDLQ